MKLRVAFDDPEHGWMVVSVAAGEQCFSEAVSHVPHDSLWQLATTLSLLLEGADQGTVTWSAEPTEYDFRFGRRGDEIVLDILEFPSPTRTTQGNPRLHTTGQFDEICRPFWKALRDLQGRFTAQEFGRRWCHGFPVEAVGRLTDRICVGRVQQGRG